MKAAALLILPGLISLSALSQAVHPSIKMFPKQNAGIIFLQNHNYLSKQKNNNLFLQDQKHLSISNSIELPVSGTVYSLPLDKMPCVVPRIVSVAQIPTLKSYSYDLSIPNPDFQPDLFPILKYKTTGDLQKPE